MTVKVKLNGELYEGHLEGNELSIKTTVSKMARLREFRSFMLPHENTRAPKLVEMVVDGLDHLGVMLRCDIDYTVFNQDGTPKETNCSIGFNLHSFM